MNNNHPPAGTPTETLISLSSSDSRPLYRQVYERIRDAISDGTLKPGDRIPSARALAKEQGVARGTIEEAYGLLNAEGYIQSRGQAGTFIAQVLKPAAVSTPATPPATQLFSEDNWSRPPEIMPFQLGVPALDAFPRKIWARLGARYLRSIQPMELVYPAAEGLQSLRTALAAYLQVARGIQCTAANIFITSGYINSLQLVLQTLLSAGDQVWVENPGYPPSRGVLRSTGLQIAPVAVDEEGLNVAQGLQQAAHARAAIVTPAHHSPLSVSLSLARRLQLLDWASTRQSWIIEDDYDGEYRYVSRPLPALKSLDRDGRVLYLGTFSKVLFPALRLAYVVVPEALTDAFRRNCQIFAGHAPMMTQSIVSSFMEEGHFARHIQRMRRLYSERRSHTLQGLQQALGERVNFIPQPGGMHLLARIPGCNDRELAQRMREQSLSAQPLSTFRVEGQVSDTLLLSFTNISSAQQAETYGRRLLALL
ncbi:DNA-binding protein [Pokkaliibacter plantistimulans]|uniref:DNA-binding protein n=1 Tax=Pokkaliibacter plantistimulans TaxID=1635171 RepID=A0ABX5LT78_9GAMM|nr:PLP-dependent aminotransferase family protein [Pokkaliibacter plantistimulans]PXF29551.1 DNA-binding protein [Pokkaliibacter plantistimulans]